MKRIFIVKLHKDEKHERKNSGCALKREKMMDFKNTTTKRLKKNIKLELKILMTFISQYSHNSKEAPAVINQFYVIFSKLLLNIL